MNRIVPWLGVLAFLAFATPAVAQPRPERAPADERARVQQRLGALRERILRRRVGLDEGQSRRVARILTRAAKERRAARWELREQRRRLGELLRADSGDQRAYATAIGKIVRARDELHRIEKRELDEVKIYLSPKQQAKLYVAVERVKKKLRRAMAKHRRRAERGSRRDRRGGGF